MSLRHPAAEAFEARLREAFRAVDRAMEERHAGRFPPRTGRPRHGTIDDFESSGLFEIGGAYSAGFGSEHGPGYVIQFNVSTAVRLSEPERQALEAEAIALLGPALARQFPGRNLRLSPEGAAWKIHGDLSLGRL